MKSVAYTFGVETTPAAASLDPDRLRIWLEDVADVWGLRPLADVISIRISTRMTRSLGNARPVEKRITLASWLMARPDPLIHEVLCHEAAHIAVYSLHGRGCRPHGKEWREIMVQAGFRPRVRIDVPDAPQPVRRRRRPSTIQRFKGLLPDWMKV